MEKQPVEIHFYLNGKPVTRKVKPATLLLDLLRDDLKLKGTKPGCHEGECGACTVLVDGRAVNSCLFLAVNAEGRKITTIEGIQSGDGQLDEVQDAMLQHWAVQCGFCTPGMVMSITSFRNRCREMGIDPGRELIRKNLEGNLCRCTGYVKIIEAVESLFHKPETSEAKSH